VKPSKRRTVALVGRTIGDLLNAAGVSWGWFSGGFANCNARHATMAYNRLLGRNVPRHPDVHKDYEPDHEPFQYFASTANPYHVRLSSVRMIGHADWANHQYDLTDFWTAAAAHHLPTVSFLPQGPRLPEWAPGLFRPPG
jgi:phospholipase C